MSSGALGLFVTLSAYGNRLHGDARGTVDSSHNVYGEQLAPRNDGRRLRIAARMSYPPTHFGDDLRACIEASLDETCLFRQWVLLAVNCRTNHAHAVIGTEQLRDIVLEQLKSRTTRAAREAKLISAEQPLWARGGSGRYLWSEQDVEAASLYTIEGQGEPLPGTMVWSEWLRTRK